MSRLGFFAVCQLATFVFVIVFSAPLATAGTPIPYISDPVHPQAVAPGTPGFTLTVRGANFLPGAVVNWNGKARSTTFVSSDELQAQILASDVSAAGAGFITVTNPGGAISSSSYRTVEVSVPRATFIAGKNSSYAYKAENVWTTVLADFNADGKLDLAQVTGLGVLAIALGRGDGSFVTRSAYVTPAAAGVGFGDFNGDGKLDLATAEDGLWIYLGNGDGSFTKLGKFGNWYPEFPLEMVVGDFNRDGALDVVVADLGGVGLQILLGNGDGTFQAPTNDPVGFAFDIQTADFNGDGNLDLLTHGLDSQNNLVVSLMIGNGDGTFQNPLTIATVAANGAAFSPDLFVNDFNNDGNFDALVGVGGGMEILLGHGDGTFDAPVFYSSTFTPTTNSAIAVGDFTSDGNSDVILSDIQTYKCGILLGNGDGTFQPITGINRHGQYTGETGIAVGDLNSDGKLDFIFQLGGDGVEIFPQQ